MRGEDQPVLFLAASYPRPTSTPAEKTSLPPTRSSGRQAHLHVRGEDDPFRFADQLPRGIPPRAWRKTDDPWVLRG